MFGVCVGAIAARVVDPATARQASPRPGVQAQVVRDFKFDLAIYKEFADLSGNGRVERLYMMRDLLGLTCTQFEYTMQDTSFRLTDRVIKMIRQRALTKVSKQIVVGINRFQQNMRSNRMGSFGSRRYAWRRRPPRALWTSVIVAPRCPLRDVRLA